MDVTRLLQTVIADERILSNAADLAMFRTQNPLLEPAPAPSHMVRPKDVPELQELVKLANNNRFALVPVSSAGPHLKGGITCSQDHIIVDLSGWKQVPWVQRKNRVCIVEPGVTYGESSFRSWPLEGMTVPTPLAPRAGKSVFAAVMDREACIWPGVQWEIQDPVDRRSSYSVRVICFGPGPPEPKGRSKNSIGTGT